MVKALGYTVNEMLLFRVAAKVGEGKNDDRRGAGGGEVARPSGFTRAGLPTSSE